MLVVVVFVLILKEPSPPIHHIKLLGILRTHPHPLHPRAAFGDLANPEAVDLGTIDEAFRLLLSAMRIGVRERRWLRQFFLG